MAPITIKQEPTIKRSASATPGAKPLEELRHLKPKIIQRSTKIILGHRSRDLEDRCHRDRYGKKVYHYATWGALLAQTPEQKRLKEVLRLNPNLRENVTKKIQKDPDFAANVDRLWEHVSTARNDQMRFGDPKGGAVRPRAKWREEDEERAPGKMGPKMKNVGKTQVVLAPIKVTWGKPLKAKHFKVVKR